MFSASIESYEDVDFPDFYLACEIQRGVLKKGQLSAQKVESTRDTLRLRSRGLLTRTIMEGSATSSFLPPTSGTA